MCDGYGCVCDGVCVVMQPSTRPSPFSLSLSLSPRASPSRNLTPRTTCSLQANKERRWPLPLPRPQPGQSMPNVIVYT